MVEIDCVLIAEYSVCVFTRELTSWIYQESTAIESKRQFPSSTTIIDYAVLNDSAVLVITNTFWAEIYPLKSLEKEPLFRLHLRHPVRVFSFNNTFFVLTNDGSLRCLTQQITKNTMKFTPTSNQQLKIPCSRLLCSLITLQSKPSLVVLGDDQHSLAICSSNEITYIDIDLSKSSAARLSCLSSTTSNDNLFFYFENKSLFSCRIDSSSTSPLQLTPYGIADLYALKNTCLATVLHDGNRLNLHQTSTGNFQETIQLEDDCEQLCLNESGEYVFALVKPRILCMYRVKDRQRLGRLFVYDTATTMIASESFILLGMNDRRLLTLLIADPDDPLLSSKIQALPSRTLKRDSYSAGKTIVEQVQNYLDMSSDDYDSDLDSDDQAQYNDNTRKVIQPITSFRYVSRLRGKLPLAKMHNEESYRLHFLKNYAGISMIDKTSEITIDDSDVDDDDDDIVTVNPVPVTNSGNEQTHNLDDLRAKSLEYDRQQIKGIQLANAGANNLKIINNYSVTSSTCVLS